MRELAVFTLSALPMQMGGAPSQTDQGDAPKAFRRLLLQLTERGAVAAGRRPIPDGKATGGDEGADEAEPAEGAASDARAGKWLVVAAVAGDWGPGVTARLQAASVRAAESADGTGENGPSGAVRVVSAGPAGPVSGSTPVAQKDTGAGHTRRQEELLGAPARWQLAATAVGERGATWERAPLGRSVKTSPGEGNAPAMRMRSAATREEGGLRAGRFFWEGRGAELRSALTHPMGSGFPAVESGTQSASMVSEEGPNAMRADAAHGEAARASAGLLDGEKRGPGQWTGRFKAAPTQGEVVRGERVSMTLEGSAPLAAVSALRLEGQSAPCEAAPPRALTDESPNPDELDLASRTGAASSRDVDGEDGPAALRPEGELLHPRPGSVAWHSAPLSESAPAPGETRIGPLGEEWVGDGSETAGIRAGGDLLESLRFTQAIRSEIFQMVRNVSGEFHEEGSALYLRLQPERLGDLELRVAIEEGVISARFVAQTEQVRALIEAALPELRQQLEESGIGIDQLAVYVGSETEHESSAFGRQGEAAGGRFSQPTGERADASLAEHAKEESALSRGIPALGRVDLWA